MDGCIGISGSAFHGNNGYTRSTVNVDNLNDEAGISKGFRQELVGFQTTII